MWRWGAKVDGGGSCQARGGAGGGALGRLPGAGLHRGQDRLRHHRVVQAAQRLAADGAGADVTGADENAARGADDAAGCALAVGSTWKLGAEL